MQSLSGVLSAREFVWWYNGHPEFADLQLDLSKVQSVAICGLGNVAVDCARILLQPAERLASTDVAQHALQQLRTSSVNTVHLVGRRGPVQVHRDHPEAAAYTNAHIGAYTVQPMQASDLQTQNFLLQTMAFIRK